MQMNWQKVIETFRIRADSSISSAYMLNSIADALEAGLKEPNVKIELTKDELPKPPSDPTCDRLFFADNNLVIGKRPYITIGLIGSSWAAIMMAYYKDIDSYDIFQAGVGRYQFWQRAADEAIKWADDEKLDYRPPLGSENNYRR